MNFAEFSRTILTALDAHPLLERLAFASAELAVLAVLIALAIAGLRIRSPRACAMLWLIVLAKPIVTLAFGAVIPVLRLAPPDPIIAEDALSDNAPVGGEAMFPSGMDAPETRPTPVSAIYATPAKATIPTRPPINWRAETPRALAALWLAGVALMLLATLLDRIRLHRFLSRTTDPSEHASAALAQGAASLQLRANPPLRVTAELESPAVVGWFRSTIVIPHWLNAPENETALAWALRHELTHLKHRDPIANALRRLAQILFFFHPVTWWASRRWEAAVELACDRAVVRTDDDVTAYAEQLYTILVQARQQRQRTMATGLFATRTQINTRIAALLGNSLNTPARLGLAAVAALTLFAGTVFAVGGAIAEKSEATGKENRADTTSEADGDDPAKNVNAKLPARTLNFPDDRSLGTLYLSDPIDFDTAPDQALLMYRFDAWKKLGEARGRVEIPAGKIVRLSATVAWTDEAFAALPANGIQHLNLSSDAFSPAGMPHHTVWRGLLALGFDGAAFPASELPHLATLENVRWLDLRGANLDSHALEFVTSLTQLRGLNLAEVNLAGIEASPLKGFANLGQLQLLDLSGTGVNGASLREISSSTELVSLSLERCPVTNGDLDALAGLANLKALSLERTGITDGYKTALGKLPNITSLKVDYTDTPDAEHRATALGGRIIAEDGQPASGVYVTLGTEGPDQLSHGRTNANGRWQVLVQTGWTRAAVLMSGGGHMNEITPRILSETEVARLRDGTLEITARPGTSLSGIVLDPGGNPVEGARIRRDDREMPREQFHESVRTDNEGRFTIDHLDETQDLALAILGDGHAPLSLHVPAGREKPPVTVTLGDALVFHGEVRDATEEPVEGVVVRATSWRPGTDYAPMQDDNRPRISHMHRLFEEARSDTDGKFTISNLPSDGKVQFSLRRADYFSARLNAEPPFDDDAIVYVIPEAPFRGRVLDADTGSPVSKYEIEFDISAEDEHFYWREKYQPNVTRNAATGEFSANLNYTLEAATSPEFAARVTAEGYARTESTIVTADRLGEVITIKLQRLNLSQIDTLSPGTSE